MEKLIGKFYSQIYHEYYFERNSDSGKGGLVCSNGRIIGEIMMEDGECLVDIRDEEREYVSNTISNNENIKLLNQSNEIER